MMHLRSGAITGPGRVRQVNQDRYIVQGDRLFVVADGMGGHRGGEVAAQLAVDALNGVATVRSSSDLERAITQANQLVFKRSGDDPELSGMGTTVTAIALIEADGEPLLSIANVGDSRTYRLTGGGLEQLTEDHSVVGELLRDGRITPEEATLHRHRSVITRALGVEPTVDVDIIEVIPTAGERYLLCSDGLHGEVTESAIASILRRFADPREACEELMAAAMAKGGRDNITAIVVDVHDDTDAALLASHALGPDDTLAGARSTAPMLGGSPANPANADAKADVVASGKAKPPKVRKPSPINLRVVLFIAVLAGLGGIVAWVVSNAPKDETPPSVVVTTDAATTVTTVTTTTAPTTAPVTATTTQAATPTKNSTGTTTTMNIATSTSNISTTTVAPTTTDPFADPTEASTTTVKSKKKP